jgi:hypothetical protein
VTLAPLMPSPASVFVPMKKFTPAFGSRAQVTRLELNHPKRQLR